MSDIDYALYRMSTPLHESRLSGATAKEDARCMQIIADELTTLRARIAELVQERDRLLRGEYICKRCGLRKDSERSTSHDF